MKKLILLTLLVMALNLYASNMKPVELKKSCFSTREYVTTMSFLRGHSEFVLKEDEIKKISNAVSERCSGASLRFIKVSNLLIKAGMDSASALKIGLGFSKEDDVTTDSFINIFKQSFVGDFLDLDLRSAVTMAKSLTMELEGDREKVFADFEKMVDFCMGGKGLTLPKPQCAQLAQKISRMGDLYKESSADAFVAIFEFMTEGLPQKSSAQAVSVAQNVLAFGPVAADNFIKAYTFAVDSDGLNISAHEALEFAMTMATRSLPSISKQD